MTWHLVRRFIDAHTWPRREAKAMEMQLQLQLQLQLQD